MAPFPQGTSICFICAMERGLTGSNFCSARTIDDAAMEKTITILKILFIIMGEVPKCGVPKPLFNAKKADRS